MNSVLDINILESIRNPRYQMRERIFEHFKYSSIIICRDYVF